MSGAPKTRKHRLTIVGRNALAGWLFVSPFLIGLVVFFATPLLQSLRIAFSSVSLQKTAMTLTSVGWTNFRDLMKTDAKFLPLLGGYFLNSLYQVPIILLFSLFIGLLLVQNFRGRTLARAVFFLPVIISSGIVINILGTDLTSRALQSNTNIFITNNRVLTELLLEARIASTWIQSLLGAVSAIFDLTWKSGVQILLFLAALSSIPKSFYEASSIEGASGWVSFWKITFPMISPYILVCFVLTIVESFTDTNNAMIDYIYQNIKDFNYGPASAMSWVYMLSVFLVIGVVLGLFSKRVFYQAS